MSTSYGRLDPALVGKSLPNDSPENKVAAMLTNQDAIIAALKALTAKLDLDAGVTDVNYASLISNALAPIDLTP